jgi:hypothetical protein
MQEQHRNCRPIAIKNEDHCYFTQKRLLNICVGEIT